MVKIAAIAMIVLGVIHLLVLGVDVPAELPRWFSLNLWTFDHWQPVRSQEVDLALSNNIFWATIGSLAVPLIILGSLILWMDRRGLPIPGFVGYAMVAWSLVTTLIMPPSGLPLVLLASICLTIGLARGAKRA